MEQKNFGFPHPDPKPDELELIEARRSINSHTQDEVLRDYDFTDEPVIRSLGDTATFAAVTVEIDGAQVVPGEN